ncbi:cupin domain-containing protein [Blastomyces dermatitidis ER-3]|uniref:Cupin domain-containing protein n=2 Tax=Ajellomyces dermatitidis TaxID=5039 RepID=F2TCB3_AJEDA|nr:cupin domain-containing protein [Blastomyces dermatitidis ER-3]EEQ89841.1 cupin domain-containing protein [Blastomyces dermatitidis ER-3]EGE80876.1 cupin domain-containing protein [Blastomyces dermatitidis ATCC 18188]
MPEQSPQRFITTHDASGASVFDASIPTTVPDAEYPGGLSIFKPNMQPKAFPHPSAQTPISKSTATASPTQEGSLLTTSHMHRTLNVDTGMVIEGSLELLLDSGESRVLRKGDVFVQRATMHRLKNMSSTEPVTMVVFIQPCALLEAKDLTAASSMSSMASAAAADKAGAPKKV